ncbi:gamma-glutamyltransferase [Pseudooceanicola sp. CBS1P-1]|uniref:Glutathione hydrolase proenzyme n=1 Tax=Pseudooceanicola albus TaxID=2692189 RepID=A0A6L7G630_9RHOB|nr:MULTISPECIES: gamma-glutamyltransferase [Pseudooceanicola]MBT9386081.1 gamma-glutamyltransferase [Pseudooceanicola endophyticus]MXN19501.1 gamma-glutamyltransferase [Pseudooceanicola albus]
MTAAAPFQVQTTKFPVRARGGIVTANHPLGAAAGAEMLAAGGNAVDAAVATLLTLTVVEPMMVGICGGGLAHVRLPDGTHEVIDGLSAAGERADPAMFTPVSDHPARYMEAEGRLNDIGRAAVAVPGSLAAWAMMHDRHGRLPFADLVQPAIRHARGGFKVTHYLAGALHDSLAYMGDAIDPAFAAIFLPGGKPLAPGDVLIQEDYARSLEAIAAAGAAALHGGRLGQALVDTLAEGPLPAARLTLADLEGYAPQVLAPIRGHYRGLDVYGPPPPASSGVHVPQMLNMLAQYDLSAMAYDAPERLHLLGQVMRRTFRDRNRYSGDPRFVDVPVERLISEGYALECLAELDAEDPLMPERAGRESTDTTHVTIADGSGMIVSATFTINGLFGAKFVVPGTGIIPNNYNWNFDPRPGKALSVVPGKRVPTSMAPLILTRDDRPVLALGLPGATRIFPSAMQAILNIVDHGMDLQTAVEAPRVWSQGQELELEPAFHALAPRLEALGNTVKLVRHIGGGLNAIRFHPDGTMEGACCWRADGTVLGLGGGRAAEGVRFAITAPDSDPD